MMQINKLSIRILFAIVIGLLLAGAGTKITYPCTPTDGAAGCVSFDKAVMHPSDFINNKQESLTHFTETFVITSLLSFTMLSILSLNLKKAQPATQPKD